MMTNNILEVNAEQYGNVYLMPAILISILSTSKDANLWLMENCPEQYVRNHNRCDLIYRNGYIKIYDEMTRPGYLLDYLDIKLMAENLYRSPSVAKHLMKAIDRQEYIVLDLDEYYIEHTYFFNRRHYYRKFLINGYDKQAGIVRAYSHDERTVYRPFCLSMRDLPHIIQKGNQILDTANRFAYGSLIIRKNPSCGSFAFSLHRFLYRLNLCLENRKVEVRSDSGEILYTDLYGFQMYDVIVEKIRLLKENIVQLDYRVFSMVEQRLARMADTIDYLKQELRVSELHESAGTYRNLASQWKRLFFIFLKPYRTCYTERYRNLDEIIHQINSCKETEKICLNGLIERLRYCL